MHPDRRTGYTDLDEMIQACRILAQRQKTEGRYSAFDAVRFDGEGCRVAPSGVLAGSVPSPTLGVPLVIKRRGSCPRSDRRVQWGIPGPHEIHMWKKGEGAIPGREGNCHTGTRHEVGSGSGEPKRKSRRAGWSHP